MFWLFARDACREIGRGVIVMDTTVRPSAEVGHPFGYHSRDEIAQINDQTTGRMVGEAILIGKDSRAGYSLSANMQ